MYRTRQGCRVTQHELDSKKDFPALYFHILLEGGYVARAEGNMQMGAIRKEAKHLPVSVPATVFRDRVG